MIGLENKDSSFFTIASPDVTLDTQDFSKDIMSFSITERMDSMPQGQIVFNDPKHYFSRILRTGVKLQVSWGYRKQESIVNALFSKTLNFDEVTGLLTRRGLEGFVSSPAGQGRADGITTYNCNFTSFGFRGADQTILYTSGTKAGVVSQAFDELGIDPIRRLILFSVGNDTLTTERAVRQDETTFRFLTRLAKEWKALFTVNYTQDGTPTAMFIDPDKIGKNPFALYIMNATGSSHAIGYKGRISNVISYTWKSNESESGVGQNVRLDIVDGKVIFRRFVAEQEYVISYRLDPAKIQEAFQDRAVEGVQAQFKLAKELLSASDFDQIKHFFTAIETTTAPQGFGYRINCKMLGSPLFAPPNQVRINNGFPDRLGGVQAKYYIYEVVHTIDRTGYFSDLEIVDVFTLSPIGIPLL